MYDYNSKYKQTVKDFGSGLISKDAALRRIGEIEAKAYKLNPLAEPDGDITFAAACAAEDIQAGLK